MELKTRKRLSILILVIGMPAYVVAAVSLMNWLDGRFGRQPIWIELLIYVGVTIAWWSMGQALIGTAFALVAVVAGVLSGRRALS